MSNFEVDASKFHFRDTLKILPNVIWASILLAFLLRG